MSSLRRHSGRRTIQRGLRKSRCGESARRNIRRRGSVGGVWRRIRGEFPNMTISRVPEFPDHGSMKRSLEERRGFDIPRRVGPGAWCQHHPPALVVIELELHQNSRAMETGTKGNNTSSRYTKNFDSLNAWMFELINQLPSDANKVASRNRWWVVIPLLCVRKVFLQLNYSGGVCDNTD